MNPPPVMGSTVSTPPVPMISITVRFVMAGRPDLTVQVPAACTVQGLKNIISEKSLIFPDKQLLLYKDNELRDDDARLADYGITTDCQITMSVNMNTGVTKQEGAAPASVIFYVPVNLPQETGGLRSTVKSMTTVKGKGHNRPKRVQEKTDGAQIWTPEKQLEVELTRNRMKVLMRRKNKTKLLSPSVETPDNGGSVISSAQGSRFHSPTQTPPNELNSRPSTSESSPSTAGEDDPEVTDKELRLFFEPMETEEQLKRLQRQKSMMQPPSSLEELEELKKKLAKIEKTSCKACGKKIPPAEQALRCGCGKLFCKRHREPKMHQCKIDYKQTGRKRINKWMPKVGEGGARKGKL